MANLLPRKERKRFTREYLRRITIVVLLVLCLSGVFGTVLLLPSYFFSQSKTDAVAEQYAFLQRAISLRQQDVSGAILAATKQKLAELNRARSQAPQTALIQAIVANAGDRITLSGFFYARNAAGKEDSVKIIGTAPSRESLIDFSNRLKQEELFTRVDLPVSSFAKDADIDFTLTVFGDFSHDAN